MYLHEDEVPDLEDIGVVLVDKGTGITSTDSIVVDFAA